MDPDEPEKKKRPHLNSAPSFMARNSTISPSRNNSVDAPALQYQNQKLVQQIDSQRHELHDLETKIKELKDKQSSYNETLIAVNRQLNRLVDDLVLLGVQAGQCQDTFQNLECANSFRGSIPSCQAEEMFLCRLLQKDCTELYGDEDVVKYVEQSLLLRHESVVELFKVVEETIDNERVKTENIASGLHGNLTSEDAIIQLSKIDDMMKEEAGHLRKVTDILQLKHKEYADEVQTYISCHSIDQSEIKRLGVELDESMAELEESRRKLVNLTMQKNVALGMQIPTPCVKNGDLSPLRPTDRAKGLRELKDSIEETRIVAADRLSELQDAREDNLNLSKQLQDLENELKDDKYVHSSRLYALLNDQLQHWNAELEHYKAVTNSLQAERSFVMRREKELNSRVESIDAARNAVDNADSRIEELERQLKKCVLEKNDLEIRMEEAVQDSGREDIKAEFEVMSSALSREMEMMEAQLKRWKETAHEAVSLREKAQSLRNLLSSKSNEQKILAERFAQQIVEIKSLKALVEKLQKEKLEREMLLDMYGQENYENRDLKEIKDSECRAHSQAGVLRSALEEHSLELRVKAANEAETACQQRLSTTEAEIYDLRTKLDASERDVLELTENIKIKDLETEAYISEIETIGQAYEDMQTQNQNLLQQVTKRDDYNIKLVSETVKTKQTQSSILFQKQALAKKLQQVNASVEAVKARIAHSEEQLKACLEEAAKLLQEDRHLAVNLETARWDLSDAEKELKWIKSAAVSSEKECEQMQQEMDDVQTELEAERNSRKKIEEELRELNFKVAELSSETGEAAIQRLQQEIGVCKSVLKCSICCDRPKEVVIVKCCHLFCNECIKKNLGMRLRKCPACGTAYGQNDVRFVKI